MSSSGRWPWGRSCSSEDERRARCETAEIWLSTRHGTREGRRRGARAQRAGTPAALSAGPGDVRGLPAGSGADRGGARRHRRRQRPPGRGVRPRRAFRRGRRGQRRRRAGRGLRIRPAVVRRGRPGAHLVCDHRRRQRGPGRLAAAHDRFRCRHGARRRAGAGLAALPGRGGPSLPPRISLKRTGPQSHSRRQHGLHRRRILGRGRFPRIAHRRGRRACRPVRGGGSAHSPRRQAVGGDLGPARWPCAGRVRPPPAGAVGLGVQTDAAGA